jgi:hypothetical protein
METFQNQFIFSFFFSFWISQFGEISPVKKKAYYGSVMCSTAYHDYSVGFDDSPKKHNYR